MKFLCVSLDEIMSSEYLLASLCEKFARACGKFSDKDLFPLEILETLNFAIFCPFLKYGYGIVVWGVREY